MPRLKHPMFTALIAGCLALIGAVAAALIESDAIITASEPPPDLSMNSVEGTWIGSVSWKTGEFEWTLMRDGRFFETEGYVGRWEGNAKELILRYDGGLEYRGGVVNGVFEGSRYLKDGTEDGIFSLKKERLDH